MLPLLHYATAQASARKTERRLRPRPPSGDRRYDRPAGSCGGGHSNKSDTLLRAGVYCEGLDEADSGWTTYIHPEGQPYFYHANDRVLTTSRILDPSAKKEIEVMWRQLARDIEIFRNGGDWPVDTETVLELNGEEYCDYYCVSILQKSVFWLSAGEWLDLPANSSTATIRLRLEEEYWVHTAFFPAHRVLPLEDEKSLRGTLIFACADRMTAPGSTSHFTPDECRQYLSLLESCKLPTSTCSRTWLISRLMTTIVRNRNHNFWGQEAARLDRSQEAVVPQSHSPTLVEKALTGSLVQSLLFYSPTEYEQSLQFISVDDVVLPDAWKSFMMTCQRDWRMSLAVALVLLLTNASISNRSMTGLSLYVYITSTLFTIGSIASALSLLQMHRGLEHSNGYTGAEYLQRNESITLGYIPLAIRLSSPYVLMIWGFISFSCVILLPVGSQQH